MKQHEDSRQAAQRLMAQIQSSLSDVMTPQCAKALMDLKSLSIEDAAMSGLVSPSAIQAWLNGATPIMPAKQLRRLELVLGCEQGSLATDRVHAFRLDEGALGKDVCARQLLELMPLFKRSAMSIVCDDSGRDAWADGARIHVVSLANGGYAVVSHIAKSRLISSPVAEHLEAIAWADHGRRGQDRSELIVSSALAQQLAATLPREDDETAKQLAEHFFAAAQLRSDGRLRAFNHRR